MFSLDNEVKMQKYIKCNKCSKIYDVSPFANMLGNGELAYSKLTLYGDKYHLCPACTRQIYSLIKGEKLNE